jgi:hypothetical protein
MLLLLDRFDIVLSPPRAPFARCLRFLPLTVCFLPTVFRPPVLPLLVPQVLPDRLAIDP